MPKPTPLFTLCLAAMLLMTGVGMIVAILPQRVHALTGDLESVGLIASVFAVTYLAVQFPVGLLADRFGAKPFLVRISSPFPLIIFRKPLALPRSRQWRPVCRWSPPTGTACATR